MRTKDTSLEEHLEAKVVVRLPSGRQKRMSRRKATIFKYAVAAANGDWCALDLLLQISNRSAST